MRSATAREADGPLRIEAEKHPLADFQISEAARLRQGHPELEASQVFLQQHSRIGAVEQQAADLGNIARLILRQQRFVPFQGGCLRADKRFDMTANGYLAALFSVDGPAIGRLNLRNLAIQLFRRPKMRLLAPTKPATKAVAGS